MIGKPIVSVVMPVYNTEKYLSQAVGSILNQTFRDFEFIIINDGSTDGSESILKDFQKQDKRIRVISRSNTGIVVSLNEGLGYAQGDYVARMDSDDIALPERFAKQVAFLEDNPDHVVVGCLDLMIDPEGWPVKVNHHPKNHAEIDQLHMSGFPAIPHAGSMLRRDPVQNVGGYRQQTQTAEDLDLWLRLAEIGKLANISEVLLKYRLHPKSVGYSHHTKQLQAAATAVIDAHRRRRLTPPTMKNTESEQQRSINDIHQMWAWWALSDGNLATARKHALLALKSNPVSKESWKVLACAVRGW